jgi:ATP-dependent Lhr-like helicase
MADNELLEMSSQGELMLGPQGEKLTESHEFYAVFETPLDYRVIHGNTVLGVLPLDHVVAPGQTLIFAGRRWRTESVDDRSRVVVVVPSQSAMPPTFGGGFGGIHDRVVGKMREVLGSTDVPVYLDTMAKEMLDDAREAYFAMGLDRRFILEVGRGAFLFPWVGTKRLDTLGLALMDRRFKVATARHCLEIDDCNPAGLSEALAEIAHQPPPDGRALAAHIGKPFIAKYDQFLSDELLAEAAAAERLDALALPAIAARCLNHA